MCLEPADWSKCYEGTAALSYVELIELDQYYQKNSETSIDDELHHIVKLIMREKTPQIKGLEKCLFLSASQKNLFIKLSNLIKNMTWIVCCINPYKKAKKDLEEDEMFKKHILPVDEEWNV